MTSGNFINAVKDGLKDFNFTVGSVPSKSTLIKRILGGIKGTSNYLKFDPNTTFVGTTGGVSYFDVKIHCIVYAKTFNLNKSNANLDIIATIDKQIHELGSWLSISEGVAVTADDKTGDIEYDVPIVATCTLEGFFTT